MNFSKLFTSSKVKQRFTDIGHDCFIMSKTVSLGLGCLDLPFGYATRWNNLKKATLMIHCVGGITRHAKW